MSEKGIFQIVLKFLLGSGINHKLQEDFQINSRKNENTFHTAVKSCGVPISFDKSNEGFDYYSRIYRRATRGIRAIILVVARRKLIHRGASDVPYMISILGFSKQFCVACVRYR